MSFQFCGISYIGQDSLAMWRKSLIRLPVTEVKFINKSPLFILLPGVIRQRGVKLNSEQKSKHIFVAPPYSQAACCRLYFIHSRLYSLLDNSGENFQAAFLYHLRFLTSLLPHKIFQYHFLCHTRKKHIQV